MSKELELKVRSIIGEIVDNKLQLEQLTIEDDITKVGVNSISFIKLIVAIEDEYGIKFNNEDLIDDKLTILKHLIFHIQKKINHIHN